MLHNSASFVYELALTTQKVNEVVGYIQHAKSKKNHKFLALPPLEVRPDYQNRELVTSLI